MLAHRGFILSDPVASHCPSLQTKYHKPRSHAPSQLQSLFASYGPIFQISKDEARVELERGPLCHSPQDISPDDLGELLPAHLPRYIAYSYCFKHDDGRTSYPLCTSIRDVRCPYFCTSRRFSINIIIVYVHTCRGVHVVRQGTLSMYHSWHNI